MTVSPWLRYHSTIVYRTLEEALDAIEHRFWFVGPATVYAAGGIHGLSDAECSGWRDRVRERLCRWPGGGFRVLDPMARDYRGREDEGTKDIVDGDKADIVASDIVLVNASRPSWGTAMEVMFAFSLHKVVIAFTEAP